MISRTELSLYVEDLLGCAHIMDYAPNGLQVEGCEQVQKIATAVTASQDIINKASTWGAQALIVHHGYFWKGEDSIIVGMKKARIHSLLTNNINLFAYHLPLDCHLQLGNNACLGQLLGVDSVKQHKAGNTDNLLWSGTLAHPMNDHSFEQYLSQKLKQRPVHIKGPVETIHSIAWCSGGAQDFITQASSLGVDAYISGEISERTYYQAKELGIHYFACGHHATERYGIQALGNHLAQHFDLSHQFFDSDNPV